MSGANILSFFTTTDVDSNAGQLQDVSFGDNNLWFVSNQTNKIYNTTTDGSSLISSFLTTAIDSQATTPQGLTYSTSGNLWFTASNVDRVYNVTTDGSSLISAFTETGFNPSPTGVTFTNSDNLWITNGSSPYFIANRTTAGTLIAGFNATVIDSSISGVGGISYTTSNNMWIVDSNVDKIYNITTNAGLISFFATTDVDSSATATTGISFTNSDIFWMCDTNTSKIYQATTNVSNVSSHFQYKMNSTNPSSMVHKFTLTGSDISAKVVGYGTVSRDATDVIGSNFSINVENASQTFNDLIADTTRFFTDATYDFGFATDSGTNETLQLFGGKLTNAKFNESRLNLKFEDKLSRLKNITVGTEESPVSFTTSTYNPADIAWWTVTSYGGLSVVKSASNPDINYDNWLSWWNQFNDDSIRVHAEFTGEDILDILSKESDLTDSTIYAEGDNKLYFNRWTGAGSDSFTLSNSNITGIMPLQINGNSIINKVTVLTSLNVSSDTWGTPSTSQNTSSVNTFGIFEKIYDDKTIWYVDGASALNLAERVTFRRSQPSTSLIIKTPLVTLNSQLGNEMVVTSRVYSLNARSFNLNAYEKDLESKVITLEVDDGFGRGGGRLVGFKLDDPFYGKLDENYNQLL